MPGGASGAPALLRRGARSFGSRAKPFRSRALTRFPPSRAQCDSGKNRFKPQAAAGSNYSSLMAAKKAAKAAKSSSPTSERPRDKLRAQAIEMARKMDEERGRGGDKKKGWFG